MDDSFASALAILERSAGRRDRYSDTFLKVFPVAGAAVSTLGDVLGSEIVSASNPTAGRLDELQLDLGEGPCWDALRSGQPIAEPDLMSATATQRWPSFAAAARDLSAASIFAFPVAVGVVCCYQCTPIYAVLQTKLKHAAIYTDWYGGWYHYSPYYRKPDGQTKRALGSSPSALLYLIRSPCL